MSEVKAMVGDIVVCEFEQDSTLLTYRVPQAVEVEKHKALIVYLEKDTVCPRHYNQLFGVSECGNVAGGPFHGLCLIGAMNKAVQEAAKNEE